MSHLSLGLFHFLCSSRRRAHSQRRFRRQLHVELLEGRRLLTVGYPELISIEQSGLQTGNNLSGYELQSISADGRFQVFASDANNLVPNDTNSLRDIFLRNLENGTITLVSQSIAGFSANGWSQEPVISADSNYVAFASYATNLNVAGVNSTNGLAQIYRWNRLTGETILVSQNSSGTDGINNYSSLPAISGDGKRIVYGSFGTNVIDGVFDGNGQQDIFLRDLRCAGQSQ